MNDEFNEQKIVRAVTRMVERQRALANRYGLENRKVSYSESGMFTQLGDSSVDALILNFDEFGQHKLRAFLQPKNDVCLVQGGRPGMLPLPRERNILFPFLRKTAYARGCGSRVGDHYWGRYDGSYFDVHRPLEDAQYEICGDYTFVTRTDVCASDFKLIAVHYSPMNLMFGSLLFEDGIWKGSLIERAQIWREGCRSPSWVIFGKEGWDIYGS